LVGFALVCGAAALAAACSSSDDSSSPSNTAGATSSGAGASSSGAGASAGGASSFAGAASSGAGSTSVAGTSSSAGASAGGAGSMGPFTCAGTMANCNSWTAFQQSTMNSWGTGMFTGGITTFPPTFTRAAGTDSIHMSGMVTGYGFGFGLYFSDCSNLSAYTGVSFKVSGTTNASATLIFQLQTNADYPYVAAPMNKGACATTTPANPFGTCVAPSKAVPITTTPTTVTLTWADLTGGMPTATADPTQVLGLQWALPSDGTTAYAADVTVTDVTLTGGTGSASCNGAAGGSAAGAGAGGGAGAASAGAGGTAAGSGGTGGA